MVDVPDGKMEATQIPRKRKRATNESHLICITLWYERKTNLLGVNLLRFQEVESVWLWLIHYEMTFAKNFSLANILKFGGMGENIEQGFSICVPVNIYIIYVCRIHISICIWKCVIYTCFTHTCSQTVHRRIPFFAIWSLDPLWCLLTLCAEVPLLSVVPATNSSGKGPGLCGPIPRHGLLYACQCPQQACIPTLGTPSDFISGYFPQPRGALNKMRDKSDTRKYKEEKSTLKCLLETTSVYPGLS